MSDETAKLIVAELLAEVRSDGDVVARPSDLDRRAASVITSLLSQLDATRASVGEQKGFAQHWHREIETIGAMLEIGAPDVGEVPRAVQALLLDRDATRAERDGLAARLQAILDAEAIAGVRELVAGWNGEGRPDGPYKERHPVKLGATLPKTTCGAVYALDEALTAARAALKHQGAET